MCLWCVREGVCCVLVCEGCAVCLWCVREGVCCVLVVCEGGGVQCACGV